MHVYTHPLAVHAPYYIQKSSKSCNPRITCLHFFILVFQVKERYGPNLDHLQTGHIVGVYIDDDSALHLSVNGVDQGVAAIDMPAACYVVLDLYGQCEQVGEKKYQTDY